MGLLLRLLGGLGSDTLAVPASTGTVIAVAPLEATALVIPAATGTVSAVAPVMATVFVTPTATASATTTAPALADSYVAPAAAVSAAAVAPTLLASYAVPAAGSDPLISFGSAVFGSAVFGSAVFGSAPVGPSTVALAPQMSVTFSVPTMTGIGESAAFAPTLALAYSVPAAAVTAAAVAPALTTSAPEPPPAVWVGGSLWPAEPLSERKLRVKTAAVYAEAVPPTLRVTMSVPTAEAPDYFAPTLIAEIEQWLLEEELAAIAYFSIA